MSTWRGIQGLPHRLVTGLAQRVGSTTVSHASVDRAFVQWLSALRTATGNADDLRLWQERRFRFAHQLGQLLSGPADPCLRPVAGHALYGVYLDGGIPVYIGQTREAQRRLRDLPIGESHHLGTTVPAEIWERIVVVQWPELLDRTTPQERGVANRLGLDVCGLALEHLFQLSLRPVLTARRRTADGTWSERRPQTSHSKGAIHSSSVASLFAAVQRAWNILAAEPTTHNRRAASYAEFGRVVFPQILLTSLSLIQNPM